MSAKFLQQAFDLCFPDAQEAELWFVSLVVEVPFYGGPEEGGWWGRDTELVSWCEFPSEEIAKAAAAKVEATAAELSHAARLDHGRYCLESMDWLHARGLDADFLPEPDGPCEYRVVVTCGQPAESRMASRQWS